MELKTDVVQSDLTGVTTYYLKLFDQYTNRDVWGIADSQTKNNVDTSYLGWEDESITDSVSPSITFEDSDEGEDEDEDDVDEDDEGEDEDTNELDSDVPNQEILAVNFAISETLVFEVKDVQDAIQQLRSILLVYDLILPPVTIFGETPREIYDIELFDKNFKRFWLLHLDIIRVSDTYQVYAGVVSA